MLKKQINITLKIPDISNNPNKILIEKLDIINLILNVKIWSSDDELKQDLLNCLIDSEEDVILRIFKMLKYAELENIALNEKLNEKNIIFVS